MNQVEYTLLIQKIFLIAAGASFLGICSVLVFLDPYDNSLYVWGFLILFYILLMSLISLLVFWWYFGLKKEILSINQVNSILYQSSVSAIVAVTMIVLNQTNQLNPVSVGIVVVIYIVYWLWFTSKEKEPN